MVGRWDGADALNSIYVMGELVNLNEQLEFEFESMNSKWIMDKLGETICRLHNIYNKPSIA